MRILLNARLRYDWISKYFFKELKQNADSDYTAHKTNRFSVDQNGQTK